MATVGTCFESVIKILQKQSIHLMYEYNPGNHFQDVELRMTKGIQSLLLASGKRGGTMIEFLYLGDYSCRLISRNNTVLYINPEKGKDYSQQADIILQTTKRTDH